MRTAVLVLALLGGVIGIANAIWALVAVGGDPAYSGRLLVGWAALILALLAGAAGFMARTRPGVASLAILIAGVLGFVAINLYYINTFYALALLFWLAASVLGFAAALTKRPISAP
jgi:hypothetical protein